MSFPAPTVQAPTLATWQAQLGALTIGEETPWGFDKVTGVGITAVRSGDSTRPRDTGQWAGLDLLGGRTIVLGLTVVADTTSLESSQNRLAAALQPGGKTETPFWFKLPGHPQLCSMVRLRKRSFPVDLTWSAGLAFVQLQLRSKDPLLYGDTQVGTVGLPLPLGGLGFNATFPLSFGGGSATGDLVITNTGNAPMRPILVITGPCTDPKVANDQTGWSLKFSNPSQTGLTLQSGDTLTVDLSARTVTLVTSGTTVGSAREFWTVAGSVWPTKTGPDGLAAGLQTIQFSSSDATYQSGQLAVRWAPSFLY